MNNTSKKHSYRFFANIEGMHDDMKKVISVKYANLPDSTVSREKEFVRVKLTRLIKGKL